MESHVETGFPNVDGNGIIEAQTKKPSLSITLPGSFDTPLITSTFPTTPVTPSLARSVWYNSVFSALQSEKLSCKTKAVVYLDSKESGTTLQYERWLEIRARFFSGRPISQEVTELNRQRSGAQSYVSEIESFQWKPGSGSDVLEAVQEILTKFYDILDLYPSRKALEKDVSAFKSSRFRERMDALQAWINTRDGLDIIKGAIAFQTSQSPVYSSKTSLGLPGDLFFSVYFQDAELVRLYRGLIVRVVKKLLRFRDTIIDMSPFWREMGLPIDQENIKDVAAFVLHFEVNAMNGYATSIEGIMSEDRPEILDTTIYETIQKLKFTYHLRQDYFNSWLNEWFEDL